MKYHLTSVRMSSSKTKNLQTINAKESVEKREPSYPVGGNVNRYSYYAEQYRGSSKKHENSQLSVLSLSHIRLFVTPWTAACQASLSITNDPAITLRSI